MTSFAYWAAQVPDGMFLCGHCYEGKPVAEAWRDEDGQAWDVCVPCHVEDMAAVARKRAAES